MQTPCFTLALWILCLITGVLGLMMPYPHPGAAANEPEPPRAQRIEIQIAPEEPTSPQAAAPPPKDQAVEQNPPPLSPPALALPAPAIVQMTASVPSTQSIRPEPAAVEPAHAMAAPVVQHLTYGRGEGRQPAPEYPPEAVMARQEGVVIVRLAVGPDGRVIRAVAISPCPWPLLNQAALRAVSERWNFRSGPVRAYEVSIQFELKGR